ncbi:histidine ammonia-lyase [Ensifer adhaerens]|uniref:histidine ammonia-lyase n=1 Tax=Ensifer adhaerens TaxID=106592 RepID=UPI00098EED3F|nr:histidine ammonia-lyase [Ensifer adhaerens]
MPTITIDNQPKDIAVWRSCYLEPTTIALSPKAVAAICASHRAVQSIVEHGKPVYGINTGFGKMANRSVAQEDLERLQYNLVVSHCVGAGDPLPTDVVRLAIALKIAALAKGYSGVRLELVERLQLFLELEIYPVVPAQGSVGASGDLAPLAHLSAALIGFGDVDFKGAVITAAEAHRRMGIEPLELQAKEGLALLNGTQVSTALALAGLFRAERALASSVVIGALTTEAVLGLSEAFDARIHALRRHPGQINVAQKILDLISDSGFRAPALTTGRRQDPYSIRCQPQVLGACRDLLASVANVLALEADAVTDNPLVFADTLEVLSGGNFHAEPVAFAADTIALAICEIGSIAERRLSLMTDPGMSGLPPFLTSEPGLNSGFMCAQIAAAAMVAENRQKSHPASVDNVPTVANQEDHVSMATHGARRLLAMVDTLNYILATELLAAVEGCDHHGFQLGSRLEPVRQAVRERVARMDRDRYFAPDHAFARDLVTSGALLAACGWSEPV